MFAHMDIDRVQFPRLDSWQVAAPVAPLVNRLYRGSHCFGAKTSGFVRTHCSECEAAADIDCVSDLDRKECAELQKCSTILECVSTFFAISATHICGRRRVRSLQFPRMVFLYLCVQHTQCSESRIGAFCGNRHASTVRSQCIVLQKLMLEQSIIMTVIKDLSRETVNILYQ